MSRCAITCVKNEKGRIGAFCELMCCFPPFSLVPPTLPSFSSLFLFLSNSFILPYSLVSCSILISFSPLSFFISFSSFLSILPSLDRIVSLLHYFSQYTSLPFSRNLSPSLDLFPPLSLSLPSACLLLITSLKWVASSLHSLYFSRVSYGRWRSRIGDM